MVFGHRAQAPAAATFDGLESAASATSATFASCATTTACATATACASFADALFTEATGAFGAVGLCRLGAQARQGIARANVVAFVAGHAFDGCAGARTILARFGFGTGATIVACRAIGFRRITARADDRIASARVVALIHGHTHDRDANTFTGLANIVGCAAIAIVANGAIRLVGPFRR